VLRLFLDEQPAVRKQNRVHVQVLPFPIRCESRTLASCARSCSAA
jgi:hypothetical protein